MLGPVFRFEAIRSTRRGRFYATRVAFGLALLLYVWSETTSWQANLGRFPTARTAGLAATAFGRFAVAQFLAVAVLVPALTAGAIGEEARRRTLPDLLASNLTCAEILLGKVAARWLHVVAGVLLGLPIVGLLGLLGGLDPGVVLLVYALTGAVLLFVGGLSTLVSALVLRPGIALLFSYLLTLVWLVLPILLVSWSRGFAGNTWLTGIGEAVLLRHPLGVFLVLQNMLTNWLWVPGGGWVVGPYSLPSLAAESIAIHAGLGTLALMLGVLALKARREGWLAFPARRFRASQPVSRPPCGDRPMLWKERYVSGLDNRSSRAAWVLAVLTVAAVVGYLADPIRQGLRRGPVLHPLIDALRAAFVTLNLIALLVVAALGALSIVGEKERDTWLSLRTTLVTGREIVRAKQFGAVWTLRWLLPGFVAVWAVGLLSGAVSGIGVVATALGLAVFGWFASALGVAVSTLASDTPRALVLTLGVLFLTQVGYLVPLLALWHWLELYPPIFLFGMTPYVQWAALLAPEEWSRFQNHGVVPPMIGPLIVYRGPSVIPTYVLSLALHASASWGLTRWASLRLDAPPSPARVLREPSRQPAAPAL
jgi:ABC-type transport system involved in multi-copper enzyme maturation permease subunit